jgi:hypothetical protein
MMQALKGERAFDPSTRIGGVPSHVKPSRYSRGNRGQDMAMVHSLEDFWRSAR